jgi:hypothetical protein
MHARKWRRKLKGERDLGLLKLKIASFTNSKNERKRHIGKTQRR